MQDKSRDLCSMYRLESYKDLRCSDLLADKFYEHSQDQGLDYIRTISSVSGGSTDQGASLHILGFLFRVNMAIQETLATSSLVFTPVSSLTWKISQLDLIIHHSISPLVLDRASRIL
jgi:hypothetical protein